MSNPNLKTGVGESLTIMFKSSTLQYKPRGSHRGKKSMNLAPGKRGDAMMYIFERLFSVGN